MNLCGQFCLLFSQDAASVSEENWHMMTMVGMLRQLEELVWMVHPRELCTKMGVNYVRMCPKNVKVRHILLHM